MPERRDGRMTLAEQLLPWNWKAERAAVAGNA
jgi:hypothetical protein